MKIHDAPFHDILRVRNTAGEESAFSVQRFVQSASVTVDGAISGETHRLRLARQFLADAERATLALVTTDDIRHWLTDQDPNLLVIRRAADARLALISHNWNAPLPSLDMDSARLVADHFRPGIFGPGQVQFQEGAGKAQGDVDTIPPWPAGEGKEKELEKTFGGHADGTRLLDDAALKKLLEGTREDVGAVPPAPDFSKPHRDFAYDERVNAPMKSRELSGRAGRKHTRGGFRGIPECAELWQLSVSFNETRASCDGVDYEWRYRATLLRAWAEAFRLCRTWHKHCRTANLWMYSRAWNCVEDAGGFQTWVSLGFIVRCVDG